MVSYVNYILFETLQKMMYCEHLQRLQEVKKKNDQDIVIGLAGGWIF